MLAEAERPLIVAGGGIVNADASDLLVEFAELIDVPVIPTLMGWGTIPDDHALMAGMVGLQTSHRYGNATMLESDFVLGIGNRWANRHTGGVDTYTEGRTFVHVDIEPTQIGRVFAPDYGIVSDAKAALEMFVEVAREQKNSGSLPDRSDVGRVLPGAQGHHAAAHQLRRRPGQAAARVPGDEQRVRSRHPLRLHDRPLADPGCPDAARLQAAELDQRRPGGSAGLDRPGRAGRREPPTRRPPIVALSGDYDFQFMIEELAVGAQHKVPYIHVVVNNAYLGLIRQAQRGFEMDYNVDLAFENINTPEIGAYGVDHVKVAEGLGCKALRVFEPDDILPALEKAKKMMVEHEVPIVVEVILERITNISMGTEIDNINEFEDLAETREDAPTAVAFRG